jgi:hypothetical protein
MCDHDDTRTRASTAITTAQATGLWRARPSPEATIVRAPRTVSATASAETPTRERARSRNFDMPETDPIRPTNNRSIPIGALGEDALKMGVRL